MTNDRDALNEFFFIPRPKTRKEARALTIAALNVRLQQWYPRGFVMQGRTARQIEVGDRGSCVAVCGSIAEARDEVSALIALKHADDNRTIAEGGAQ